LRGAFLAYPASARQFVQNNSIDIEIINKRIEFVAADVKGFLANVTGNHDDLLGAFVAQPPKRIESRHDYPIDSQYMRREI
jgi:hypothetical protein